MFPEINYDRVDDVRGMDIMFVHDGEDRRGGARRSSRASNAVRRLSGGENVETQWQRQLRRAQQEARAHGQAVRPRKRAALKAIVMDRTPAGGRALRGVAEAGAAAAQSAPRSGCGCGAPSPAVRAAIIASSSCAVSQLRDLGSKGQIPGMVKSSW